MRKGKKHDIETEFQKNWELPEKYRDYAKEKGFDQERIDLEFEHFCIHWKDQGTCRKSWYATWQKWVLNSLKWNGNNNGNPNGPTKSTNASPIDAATEIIAQGLSL